MWWWCFKPSRTVDPCDDDENAQFDEAVKQSLKEEEKRNQCEDEEAQLAEEDEAKLAEEEEAVLSEAIKESLKEEEKRKLREDEEAKLAEALKESLKEEEKRKQFEDEQVKNDAHIAKDLQDLFSKMEYEESSGLRNNSVSSEQLNKAIEESLIEEVKRKLLEEQAKKDEQLVEKCLEDKRKGKQPEDDVEEDEKLTEMIPPHSICGGGCNFEIEHKRSVNISGVLCHPECLLCDACDQSIAIHQVSNSRGKFHKSCYDRYCYVCKEKKMRNFYQHPFWKERYCPSHESDGTPKCCSCERLEPRGTNYVKLDDRRWLCLECMESAFMDSHEGQHLQLEIREYFEGLNMKIEKQFPFLLVEKQALNKAEKEENIDYQYETVTRGICLSEAQTVMSVSKATRTGANIDTDKEPQRVVRDSEVTAILILYGLPRLLTGYILAHEMMHAYLRLNGHRKLNTVNEEGICQVLAHMWLESQRYAPIDPAAAEASASASSHTLPPTVATASKKGDQTEFEKKLVEFCINQIETDESRVYGDGFRTINKVVTNSSLQETLKAIIRWGR